ncbi:MAG: indolepyruvate ferredoxin oxidoreductase subunit alpha, partial [Chloroflexi bacterium]|nr:indolepyruvate ferredoxin oxidoreductase subunit alpha [Chloroflexota bacterium]
REAMDFPGVAVVIAEHPCLLMRTEKAKKKTPYRVVAEECIGCGNCYEICCPAISESDDGLATIDAITCAACGMCACLCPTGAIAQ